MAEVIEWRERQAPRDARPDARHSPVRDRAVGRLRRRLARQPYQLVGHDQRPAGRALLFGRRPLRRRRLSHRGQAASRTAAAARPICGRSAPGARIDALRARQPFRAQPRAIRSISCSPAASASRRSSPSRSRSAETDAAFGSLCVPEPRAISRSPTSSPSGSAIVSNCFVSDEGRRVDIAAEIARLDPEGELYVCGPIGMLEAAKRGGGRAAGRSTGCGSRLSATAAPRLRAHSRSRSRGSAWRSTSPRNQTMLEALEDGGYRHDLRLPARRMRPLRAADPGGRRRRRSSRRLFQRRRKGANLKLCTCVSRVYGASITIDTADR